MHFLVSKSSGQLDRRMRWIRKIEKEKEIERKCKKILKIHERHNNMREKKLSFDLRFYLSINFDTLATAVGKVVMVVG